MMTPQRTPNGVDVLLITFTKAFLWHILLSCDNAVEILHDTLLLESAANLTADDTSGLEGTVLISDSIVLAAPIVDKHGPAGDADKRRNTHLVVGKVVLQ